VGNSRAEYTFKSIYKIEGDILTVCVPGLYTREEDGVSIRVPDPSHDRPKSFENKPGVTLYVLKHGEAPPGGFDNSATD
jgi:hypothetical protein